MRTRKRPYTAKGKPGRVRTRPGFAVQEGFLGAGRGAAGKGPRTRGITMPVIPSPTRTRVSAVMKINPYNGRGGSPCPPEHSQIRTHGLAAMKPKVRCNPFLPLTGAVAEAPPVAEKARRGRRSGQNLPCAPSRQILGTARGPKVARAQRVTEGETNQIPARLYAV